MEIWDAKGNKVLDSVVTQNAEHVEELMQADYVSLQWVSNVKRVLPSGAYIVPFDDGVRYMLLDPHTPDQNNTDEFRYSPQFQHPKMYLGRVPYTRASKDTDGNDINLLEWEYKGFLTTFLSDLCDFITRTFTNEGITTDKFSYSILGDIEGNISVSISNNDILSVLNNVCSTLDCEWHIDWEQRRLFLGVVKFDKNEGNSLVLTSGGNVGMASVSSQRDTFYNVYLPQGSTRNMAAATTDGSYYATNRRLELDTDKYPDGCIYTDGEGKVITKSQFTETGLPKLVQTLVLDEIYPKIDLYAYDIRNRERYLLDDNGEKVIDHYGGDTPVYKRYAIWYMRLAYPVYNADGTIKSWKDATIEDTFKLIDGYTLMCSFGANTDSTLTSPLAGRDFELNYVETDNEAKELSAKADTDKGDTGVTVKKGDYEIIYTTEGSLIIPTTNEQGLVPKGDATPSKNGNKVIIFNVVMGEDFFKAAQNDLEVAAIREIGKQYTDLNQYTFNSDNVSFKKDMPSLYIGRSVTYNDGVGNTLETRIMKLTTKIDFPFMVEITVGNKVLKGSTSQLKSDVQMILSGNKTISNGITESVVRSLIKGFGGANFLSKVSNDTARGIITFLQGTNWGSFTSETGAAMTVDPSTGQTYMEVDRLKVRLKAFFEQLEIQKVGYVGGKLIVTKGQGVDILDVENIYDSEGNVSAYRCYFLGEQEGRKIDNLLRVKDQMICKDFNVSEGTTDGATNKYYWRLATAVSSDVVKRGNNVCHWVDLSATDCDTNSDIPEIGDTICHLGNREDTDRQGAEILSVVDANSPSFTIYSGINSYSLVNKEYIDMGVVNGKAYCNIYGSTYIGDRDRQKGYLRWNDDTKTFEIKGTIDITSPLSSGGTIGGAITNAANAYKGEFDAFTSNVNEVIGGFQAQIDGVIETWFYDPEPTLGNEPAVNWTDDATKDKHLGDLYYSGEGLAYRFQKEGDNYVWKQIDDTAITKALAEAKAANDAANAAQGTADSKMRVFVVQPTADDEYSVGDMWVNATYPADGTQYKNDILKCKTPKSKGTAFSINHWEKASKYTDDTAAQEAQKKANEAATAAQEINASITAIDGNVDVALKDKIITKTEAAAIKEALNGLDAIMSDVNKTKEELVNNAVYKNIAADVKTDYDTAYTNLKAAYNELSKYINDTLLVAKTITDEILSSYTSKYTTFKTKYEDYVSKLTVVRNSMDALLNTRIGDIATMLGGLKATTDAMNTESTQISGGLILSSLLALGYTKNTVFNVMSGVSGLYESGETGGGIAFWAGGHRIDINNCTKNADGTYSIGGKVVNPADFLVRHDGTGYAAGGKMWWGADGKIHADPQSFLINEEYVGNVMQLFKFEYSGGTEFTNIVHAIPQKPFESLSVGANGLTLYNGEHTAKFYIKDGVLFLDGDLAVTGGITMYASSGVTSGMIDQVYAVLDPAIFSKQGDYITIKGDIGGGTVKAVKVGSTQYDPDSDGIISLPDYTTATTVEWNNILNKPSSFIPSAHTHAISDITNLQATLDGKAAASHTHSYLPLSGGTITGDLYVNGFLYGPAVGNNPRNRYDSGLYFFNCSSSTTSAYNFGLYQWNDEFQFTYRTSADNLFKGSAFTIQGSDGQVAFTKTPKVGSTLVSLAGHTHSYLPLAGGTMSGSIYIPNSAPITHTTNSSSNWIYISKLFTGSSASAKSYQAGIGWHNTGGSNGNGALTLVPYAQDSAPWDGTVGLYITQDSLKFNGTAISLAGHTHAYIPTSASCNKNWSWSGQSGQPNWLWGSNDGSNCYVWNPSNFSVNYASSAGNASTATLPYGFTSRDSDWMGSNGIPGTYITAWGNSGGSIGFKVDGGHINVATDGYFYHGIDIYGGSLYRCLDTHDSGGYGLITTGNYTSYCAPANHTHSYLSLSGGTLTGCLQIARNSGSAYYSENIRMHSYNGWTTLMFCGSDNTADNGTSTNSWSMHTYQGNFYLNRNGSNSHTEYELCNVDKYWGIGVIKPSYTLDIYSNRPSLGDIINLQTTSSWCSILYRCSSSHLWSVGNNTSGNFFFYCSSLKKYVVEFSANGDITANGGITMYSDLRKKNVLSNEVLSVKEIAAAPLFRHTYKSDDNQYIHVGTSAQYWSGIHEDWFTRKDGEGYYQMELQNLGVAMGISLAREIVKYESKTDKKIRLMKKRINELEARVKELEERRTA